MITLNDFDYNLPKELIAQYPAKKRKLSRLLVINRKKRSLEHKKFTNLIDYLKEDDIIVINDTFVIPARLKAAKKSNGAKVEIFLLKKIKPFTYKVLAKPSKKVGKEDIIAIGKAGLKAEVLEDNPPEKIIKFKKYENLDQLLEKEGRTPLPPYIKRTPTKIDKKRYQTVYAKEKGAVAAPTAGLHFDQEYLNKLTQKGIKICSLTLHVSYGTFKPINQQDLEKGKLHSEYFCINKETASILNKAKSQGSRIVAVGTTSCRALESAVENGRIKSKEKETDLFIYPPYKFKVTDCLLTNFHLPRSSLLMLVSAFCSDADELDFDEGYKLLMKAYSEAIDKRYHFYSYGDAMFIY